MPLVVRSKVALGGGYGSQHSMDPAGLYSSWPGWRIVAPSNPFDYVGLMNTALASEDPVLVIEHTDLYASSGLAPVEDLDYFIPFGKARCVRAGNAFTVLTYLSMVPLAVQVADKLGIDAEIIDLRSLDRASLDWDTIGASIRKTNNVVVVEQGPLVCSYGALLTDEIQNRLFDELDQPVKRIVGGLSSPSVSAVLEAAAIVGAKEMEVGFLQMLADQGLPAGKMQKKLAGFS
jgi:2-oxoisovalerate dehydrogenase E1 component